MRTLHFHAMAQLLCRVLLIFAMQTFYLSCTPESAAVSVQFI